MEYYVPGRACLKCPLRDQCTKSKTGRTLQRHEKQEILDAAKAQAHSSRARRDRKRRMSLVEGSFADAANNYGFKRSRWRRLWRQEIQDWLIAGIQNIRIFLKATPKRAGGANAVIAVDFSGEKPPGGPFFRSERAASWSFNSMTTFALCVQHYFRALIVNRFSLGANL